MEIFVVVGGVEHKLSLFKDEKLEITKQWADQQVVAGYGSFSKDFSIPLDSNNMSIFGYYNIIGSKMDGIDINPNLFFDARVIVGINEFIGIIQLYAFTTKKQVPYSLQIKFYGDEKNIIKILNKGEHNKLNNS